MIKFLSTPTNTMSGQAEVIRMFGGLSVALNPSRSPYNFPWSARCCCRNNNYDLVQYTVMSPSVSSLGEGNRAGVKDVECSWSWRDYLILCYIYIIIYYNYMPLILEPTYYYYMWRESYCMWFKRVHVGMGGCCALFRVACLGKASGLLNLMLLQLKQVPTI